MNSAYLETARLLTQVAPFVFADDTFALKGGTAINLFVRDMPRLSVDLDLVFPDHAASRDEALARINAAIERMGRQLAERGFQTFAPTTEAGATKLLVRRGHVEVKIEANYVLRGTVQPVRSASLSPLARDILMADLDIPVVSLEDLYGGKLVAALDRQHPRDLFDVMQLFEHEGITPGIRQAAVVYLASHNRPVHEVLSPALRNIERDYRHNFQGMTAEPVPISDLLTTRDRLIQGLHQGLEDRERRFLLSLVEGAPDWSLMDIAHVEQLPAIRWKLQNLGRLRENSPQQFVEQADALRQLLNL
ncbi:nucleotidyl transferase AbiEii/AbiGii toxin family protein [Thioalkalivibrio sp. ALE16]|uniref:nucleotidyl transferase AbiEii/AbiGii toxin family protein n=1 Tax=Thioalkalivibrio sp. ALE16 TaxID=1158172 RepID=UPI00037C24A4|nr:nucleotidyl transferase AbiEii/AbiGii toxin family protein [Thioalkalivibrio sp. ALE16]